MKRLVSLVLCLLLVGAFITAHAAVSTPVVYCDGTKVKSQKIYDYDLADGTLTIKWDKQSDASKYYYKCIGLNEKPDFSDSYQSSRGTVLAEKTVTSHTTSNRKFTVTTSKMEAYSYLKIAVATYDSAGTAYWLNFGVELTDSDKIVTEPDLKCDGSSVDSRELVKYDLAVGTLTIKWTPQSAADHYYYKCIGLNEKPDFDDSYQSNRGTTIAEDTVTSNTTTKCKFTLTTSKMENYGYLKVAVAAYDSNGKAYWKNFGVQLTDSSAEEMTLSDTSLSFAYSGDSDTVTVSGASSFTVSHPTEDETVAGNKWLTVTKSGSSIKISARANYSTSSRSETITVKSSDGQTGTIKVTQKAGYSAPTASLKIGSKSYSSGDTYGPLANGGEDTLWLTITVKNARRIHVASGSYDIGSKTLNVTSSSTAAAHDCAIAIPKGVAPGTYTFTIYVSNSDVENDKWNQAITPITLKVNIISATPSTDTSFDPIWPCASSYKVTCLYYYKTGEKHSTRYGNNAAIDIGGSGSIVAVEDGVVTKKEDLGTKSFGKYIEITHNDGTVTLYAHLASFNSSVSVNAKVTKGQVIGVMGNTGNSQGTHLHFEMKGKNPFLDIYSDMYKKKVTFEKNVYSNNNSYNSDKRICKLIEDEYTLSNGWYVYSGNSVQTTFNGSINDLTVRLGEKAQLKGNVNLQGNSSINRVTVNVQGYYDATDSRVFTKAFSNGETSVKLQNYNEFVVDTSVAPFNVAGTYTVRLWASAHDGTSMTEPIAEATVLVAEPVSELPSYTEDELYQHLYYTLGVNEGSYGTVNANDNGSASVGKIQWNANAGRALPLLKKIVAKNPEDAHSILGEALYQEIANNGDGYWTGANRTFTANEKNRVSKLLSTSYGKEVQEEQIKYDLTTGNLARVRKRGVTDPWAIVYFADIINVGYKWLPELVDAAIAEAGSVDKITLDIAHKVTQAHSVYGKAIYKTRLQRTYEYLKGVTFNGKHYNDSTASAPTQAPTPTQTPVATPVPVAAGTPVFNGYTALSVKAYDLANGTLTITWNATNATKYYVSAVLLNERPVTTDDSQASRAVKTINNGTYSKNSMTLSVADLTGGQYLKFAVGSAAAGETGYHWSWIGFKLTDSTEVPVEPDEPDVSDDTGIERVTLSAVSGMKGQPGGTVTIPISMSNPDAVPLGSITVVFDLPSGVTVSKATLCGSAANASVSVDKQMVWITSMSSGITGNGKIAELTLKLDEAVSLPAVFNMNVEICHVTEQLYANPPSVAIRIEGNTKRTPGDVNLDGKINSLDAFAVLKYSVGYPVQINTANADVNADDKINSLDAFTILKYSVGYPVTLK